MDNLGSRLLLVGYSVKGDFDVPKAKDLLREVIRLIGVHEAYTPGLYPYPADGKGGTGFTLIQPITESFVAVDAWPDHGGAYLVIASCKWFDPKAVETVLHAMGFSILGQSVQGLTLSHGQA